jgi:FkbM family methyltransferase
VDVRTFFEKLKAYGLKTSLLFLYEEVRWRARRLMTGSFSQLREDLVIDDLLEHKERGFYVDVGASDPVKFNNTKNFSRKGWRGINIEPDFAVFSSLEADRPNDINLNIGIGSDDTSMTFYRFEAKWVSTLSPEKAESAKAQGNRLLETIEVPVKRLDEIFERYCGEKEIDFLSVDTEGWDLEVLEGNDWSRFRPRLVCVETVQSPAEGDSSEYRSQLAGFLEARGYREAYRNKYNSIYVLEDGMFGQVKTPPFRLTYRCF